MWLTCLNPLVQELEKEGAKAISLQADDQDKFQIWHDSSVVMGKYVCSIGQLAS